MTLKYKAMHVLIICLVLVTVAELGQYFIPKRFPDYRDILFGLLGTLFGVVIALFTFKKKRLDFPYSNVLTFFTEHGLRINIRNPEELNQK